MNPIPQQGAGSRLRRPRAGFSLIEVLVATTLLVIIVIMVGMVFRQSTLSWQSGISRADGNMLVRTVVGAIERELRLAVDARQFFPNNPRAMTLSGDAIEFVALLEGAGVEREPTLIKLTGGSEVTRTARRLRWNGSKWIESAAETTTLMYSQPGDVQPNLFFAWKENPADKPGLPLWVNLQASLTPAAGFRGVRAASAGRDRKFGTNDDIEVR